jgi:Bifunctional DNA primase/polymerase, N-terminal
VSAASLDIALNLAASGLPVFPCTAAKKPAIPRLRGGNGFKDATLDPRRVRQLWALAGDAAQLCGVPTGSASGFDVVDLDFRNGAADWRTGHRFPNTRVHGTMSGGEHWLFRHVEGVRNSASKIAPGVDVRGEGGYICFPPSPGYSIINEADIAEWPWWLAHLALKAAEPAEGATTPRLAPTKADLSKVTSKRVEGKLRSLLRHISNAPKGKVHDTLLRISRVVGGYGWLLPYSETELLGLLLKALPADDNPDPVNEKKTALAGLTRGYDEPLPWDLPDRPYEGRRRA